MAEYSGSLTAEQVAFFEAEGYLLLPDLLNADDLAAVKVAMNTKVEGIAQELLANGLVTDAREDSPFQYRLAELFADLTDADFLKFGRSWRDRLPGYFDLMANPKILDAVESLIGPEIFANPVYNTRPKVPRVAAGAVPWHQDRSYWPDANANPVITVWVALVDADEVNGCLRVIPGTHKTQLLTHHKESLTGTGYTEVNEEYVKTQRAVMLPVPAGGALLFNDRCVHMSTPNRSNHVRWSVDLRYQPTDQDPMPQHGAGFLARSRHYPERIARVDDWLAGRTERAAE
jgi:phytanoyl-CoA hydroxylase